MPQTKIAELVIAPSIVGTDFIIVDNTEVTRRTTLDSLAGFLSSVPALSSQSYEATLSYIQSNSGTWSQGNSAVNNIVISSSAYWNSTYTTVSANSATWSQANSAVNSIVISNSAYWDSVYTTVSPNSAYWQSTYSTVTANSASWSSPAGGSVSPEDSNLIIGSSMFL